jgi:hypothetical protein
MSTPCGVALIHLANEVSGLIGYREPELRALIGNTNVAVLKLRLEEAQQAIACSAPLTQEAAMEKEPVPVPDDEKEKQPEPEPKDAGQA